MIPPKIPLPAAVAAQPVRRFVFLQNTKKNITGTRQSHQQYFPHAAICSYFVLASHCGEILAASLSVNAVADQLRCRGKS